MVVGDAQAMRLLAMSVLLAGVGCVPQATIPPLVRSHAVTAEKSIPDFEVKATQAGAAGWRVVVVNNTPAIATVVWDESTFVTSAGRSAGRLINIDTLRIDTSRAHPPSPVAPGASVTEIVVPESLLADEELEVTAEKLRREKGVEDKPLVDDLVRARVTRAARILGGKLYVTIQGAAGKQTWSGVVGGP